MTETVLELERSEGVALLTLNRPAARNALNAELRAAIGRAFREIAQDGETRVAILTGAGTAFCAGLDLKETAGLAGDQTSGDFGRPEYWDAMEAFPGVVIAAVNGACVTAGFELALACDLILASSDAKFADTHVRVGVVPGSGLSQRLPRAVGIYRAKYLSLTGDYLSAEQAERWGLVSHVVPPEELLALARRIANDMLSTAPGMLANVKRVIDAGFEQTLEDGLEIERELCAAHFSDESPFSEIGDRYAGVRARGREQSEN